MKKILIGLLWLATACSLVVASAGDDGPARPIAALRLPPLDGERLRLEVVEVVYGAGESSPPHRHPCPVLVYVLEGDVRSQVDGQAPAVYRAGETYFEMPHDVHRVSANASDRLPARFLAIFVCDGDGPLSLPAPASAAAPDAR